MHKNPKATKNTITLHFYSDRQNQNQYHYSHLPVGNLSLKMLGSTTPFRQSSGGPFGSPSVFGQNSNASGNLLSSNPFGGSNPFGSSTGGSVFGGSNPLGSSTGGSVFAGTSTGVFEVISLPGQFQQSTFGSLSPPAFGTSTAAFGAPLAPAFGTSSSSSGGFGQSSNAPFGASSVFRQNSNASSNPFTTKPFGSTTTFSTPTGGSVFSGFSTGGFGVNYSSLGQQSTYGSPSPPAFGTSTTAFDAPSAPAFGTSSSSFGGPSISGVKPTFGGFASSPNQSTSFGSAFQQAQTTFGTNPFGSSSSFSASTQNAFGSSSTSGSTPAPSFTFGPGGAFNSAKPWGTSSTSGWGVSSTSADGALRNPAFDASSTTRLGFVSTTPTVGLSHSATGSSTAFSFSGIQNSSGGQSKTSTFSFGRQQRGSRLAAYTATVIADRADIWSLQSISGMDTNKDKNHEEFRWEDYQSGDKGGIGTGGFTIQSNSFAHSPTLAQSPVNSFKSSPTSNPFGPQTLITPKAPLSPSVCSVMANTQPSPVTLPQATSIPCIVPPVGFTSGMSSTNTQPSLIFQSPFLTTPLQPTQTAQTAAFANSEFPRLAAGLSGFVDTTGVLGQSTFSLPSCTQSTEVAQPVPCQLSMGHLGSTPPVRYGISSMPVLDKPAAAVRVSSLLTSRHLSHRRIRLPARKYDPKSDGPKVPFFSDNEGLPTAAKGGAVFFRRENPRALVFLPAEQWPQRSDTEKMSQLVHASVHVYKNGTISAEVTEPALVNGSLCQYEDDHLVENTKSNHEHKEHMTDVEASMPRLSRFDYYTEPQVTELAANERAAPGFCCHVKNFVVGRHGYGRIKFLGEVDVRHLDLDSHVKFNNREVMVYMDEKEKPPVGEGLNKAAEVTLLNVKCIDKMGNRYIDGPKVDKYREVLIKKAAEQGAEFVSYDPVEGEWKFRVQHFSRYGF